MHYRQIISSCALALLLTSQTALAGVPEKARSSYNQQPSQSSHASVRPVDSADALLKALTRRSLELAQRYPSTRPTSPPAGAQTQRARLSSRMSGPASHRTTGSSAPAQNLAEYLGILSRTTPGGIVSGRFSDWRSPSVYRSVGGRHNGYDVSLRAGSPAVVGWPGKVTAITPWYGREYGITVVSPDGFRTTYGHLSPAVRIGQWLEVGDVVGLVVNDHVDIKMRDGAGRYVDFAQAVPLLNVGNDRPVVSALVAGDSSLYPPLPGPDWTQRVDSVKAALNYVRLRHQEAALLSAGPSSPAPMLAQVRHDLAEARAQLLVEEVPEDVLLAAFLDVQSAQTNFAVTDVSRGSSSNALAEWLRRQQVLKDARLAVPQLKTLLHDLGS